MTAKTKVIARLTAERETGVNMIIEVHADATFSTFYHYYTQQGRKRSTKQQLRTANRNEGLRPWHRAYRLTPGLEAVADHLRTMPQFTGIKVRILRKRAYHQLLNTAPDVLGMTKAPHLSVDQSAQMPTSRIPVRIPAGWLTIQKRVSILTGRS